MIFKDINSNKFKIFSGSTLKLIAVISMLLDHTALILYSEIPAFAMPLFNIGSKTITIYYILRKIGRLAFPLFCFLLTEGYIHTKNRKKYGVNLLIFALISEIPFNLMKSGNLFYPKSQNIYFTLFFGFLLIYLFENIETNPKNIIAVFLIPIIVMLLRVDYGLNGVLLILLIYMLREKRVLQALLAYPLLSGGIAAFCAFMPINMYNNKRGFIKTPLLKYGFYIFYPAHIILLLIIKNF